MTSKISLASLGANGKIMFYCCHKNFNMLTAC